MKYVLFVLLTAISNIQTVTHHYACHTYHKKKKKNALSITEQKKEKDSTTPCLLFSINPLLQYEKCVLLFLKLDVLKSSRSKVILA